MEPRFSLGPTLTNSSLQPFFASNSVPIFTGATLPNLWDHFTAVQSPVAQRHGEGHLSLLSLRATYKHLAPRCFSQSCLLKHHPLTSPPCALFIIASSLDIRVQVLWVGSLIQLCVPHKHPCKNVTLITFYMRLQDDPFIRNTSLTDLISKVHTFSFRIHGGRAFSYVEKRNTKELLP